MRKRFIHEAANYDPGRFRFKLTFFKQVSTQSEYGGTFVVNQHVLTTMAVQEKLSERSQLALEAGASVLNQDCYFVIRNRSNFYPEKDMVVFCNGATYVIRAVVPLDVPVVYIKLLCVKQDIDITT